MICKNCGKEILDGLEFCNYCWERTGIYTEPRKTSENPEKRKSKIKLLIGLLLVFFILQLILFIMRPKKEEMNITQNKVNLIEPVSDYELKECDGNRWKRISYYDKERLVNKLIKNGRSNGMIIDEPSSYYIQNLNEFYNSDDSKVLNQKLAGIFSLIGVYDRSIHLK